jgi:CRP-like cAMP-binding protein
MEKYLKGLEPVTLFKGISRDDLKSLLHCLGAKAAHYSKNDIIFMAGDRIGSLGIVLSGQVQVVQEDYHGNKCIIGNIDAGNLFGESFSFASIETLPFSIYATTESDILFIDCKALVTPCEKACGFHSKLIFNMMNIIANKNIALTKKIEFTSKRTTREKLLAYLSAEAQKAQSGSFSIPFNRQGLADYLNVDRSAMSSELCKLRDDGILRFKRNRFEFLKTN